MEGIIFLSTPSGWRATSCYLHQAQNPHISIHALRVEGDNTDVGIPYFPLHFYPRPPGGGRPVGMVYDMLIEQAFLSTPSGWRATLVGVTGSAITNYISIHALRVEGDKPVSLSIMVSASYFYPRPPGGGRRQRKAWCGEHTGISIHALRVEGDAIDEVGFHRDVRFLSTPSGWRATKVRQKSEETP